MAILGGGHGLLPSLPEKGNGIAPVPFLTFSVGSNGGEHGPCPPLFLSSEAVIMAILLPASVGNSGGGHGLELCPHHGLCPSLPKQ